VGLTRTANQTLQKAEDQEIISNLNPNKSSGYDLFTGKILKELPIIGLNISPSYSMPSCSKDTSWRNGK
jgi:hypothetical protein